MSSSNFKLETTLISVVQIEVTPENEDDFSKLKQTFVLSEKAKKFLLAQKLIEADSTFIVLSDIV